MSDTSKSRSRRFIVIGGVALIALLAFAASRFASSFGPITDHASWPENFQTNGERIYFTGVSASRTPITLKGGGMHMSMMGGACVTCHGANRRGGRLMPRFWVVAPAIAPADLFDEHAAGETAEVGHGGHESYIDETLRRAITQGIDPSGEPLDEAMPRWSMAREDLDDLIAFLAGSPDGVPDPH